MKGKAIVVLALVGLALSGGRAQATGPDAIGAGGCTIAAPPMQATVEARMAHADDFCELLSKALAGDVFHSAVIVSPSSLWHYASASVSCSLRFGQTAEMTVRNSPATCRWLHEHGAGWEFGDNSETATTVLASGGIRLLAPWSRLGRTARLLQMVHGRLSTHMSRSALIPSDRHQGR